MTFLEGLCLALSRLDRAWRLAIRKNGGIGPLDLMSAFNASRIPSFGARGFLWSWFSPLVGFFWRVCPKVDFLDAADSDSLELEVVLSSSSLRWRFLLGLLVRLAGFFVEGPIASTRLS